MANISKQHFIRAAEIVKSILEGHWDNSSPDWAERWDYNDGANTITPRGRAVQTAEAFLLLFKEYNPRFDEQRFLQACGLVEVPPKKQKRILVLGVGYRCDNNPGGKDA